MVVLLDTLTYARKLRDAGFTDAQAQAVTEGLAFVLEERLATKQDLHDLRMATKQDLDDLRMATKQDLDDHDHRMATKQDLDALRLATKQDLDALRMATKQDLLDLEARLDAKIDRKIDDLRREMILRTSELERQLTVRLGAMLAFGLGAMATLQAVI
jgi:hypothetical protein